ncbi:MAG: metallophosphoesterase [candidate division WOR-3 bacterium]|nr:metallophosphoesterase [candidate division WOR-3 bacterium]
MIIFFFFDFTPFYFIHYSDPQIGRNIYAIPNCSTAVYQINTMSPAPLFVMITGDMAEDAANQNNLLSQWRICDSLFDILPITRFFVPGNRDIGYASDTYWSPGRLFLYRNFWGMDFYSFVHDSCLFIGLNSTLLDTYSGHSCYPYSVQQDSFLRAAIDSSFRHIFLFFHFPLYVNSPTEPNSQNNVDRPRRDTLLVYLRKYNISAVFTGHLHYNHLNFYGPALLMTSLTTSETNINSCGYRVVKVYAKGIETFVVYLDVPVDSVSMEPIVQAQIQAETLFTNIPFSFSCIVDTINNPQWQGATKRWIFQTGDTLYLSSGNYTYTDTGHYQILCQVYKSPHYAALYRFPVYVKSPVSISKDTHIDFRQRLFPANTLGKILIINSPEKELCAITAYTVDGRQYKIYRGFLQIGKSKINFPLNLKAGVYFIQIDTRNYNIKFKFVYIPG